MGMNTEYKVGDRVRCVIGTAIITAGQEYVVAAQPDWAVAGHVYVNTGEDHGVLNYTPDYFEPVATPLRIEAGKFYRTAGGQKVGPARRNTFGGWTMDDDQAGRLWQDDGQRYFAQSRGGPSDLIAEWQEPAAVAEATAALKVGDRVRLNTDDYRAAQSRRGTGTIVGKADSHCRGEWEVDVDDYDGMKLSYLTSELTRIEPPSPKFKPGDWVRDEDGDIGIVFHDDGSDFKQYAVGMVSDGSDYNFGDDDLTLVPAGTVAEGATHDAYYDDGGPYSDCPCFDNDNEELDDLEETLVDAISELLERARRAA
jgi:hypothetical protein